MTTNLSWINPRQRLCPRQIFLPKCSVWKDMKARHSSHLPSPCLSHHKQRSVLSLQGGLRGPWCYAGHWQGRHQRATLSARPQTNSSSVAGTDRFRLPPWKQPLVAAEVLLLLPSPAGLGCWPCSDPQPVLVQPCAGHVSSCSVILSSSPRSIKISALVSPCFLSQGLLFHGILPFCAEVCFCAAWLRSASVPTVPAQGDFLIPDNPVTGPRPSLIRARFPGSHAS